MGTFHDHKGELHGITVVVYTHGDRTWVGRCDTVAPQGVVLLDGDMHEGNGEDRAAWIAKAAQVGIWKRFDRVIVPTEDVASIRRLAELRA